MGLLKQRLFCALTFSDIACDLRRADSLIVRTCDRRHGQRDLNQRPVLAHSDRLIVLDAFAGLQPGDNVGLFVYMILRNQNRYWLADYFISCIAEHTLSSSVPTGDDAIKGLRNDCIVG